MWGALWLAWFWHGVHLSTATVDYQTASKRLEVMITLSADHLEEVLRRKSGREIELDRTAEAETWAREYVLERFDLRYGGGRKLPLKWVGWEIKGGSVNLYVEADWDGAGDLKQRNDLMLDWQRDQVNRVLPKRDGRGKPPQLMFWVGTRGEFQALGV
ncbi:MAG: DUF6702 family protein [Acidobacteriota bacterium]